MTHTPTWDPGQYQRFATSRLRPALYLLRQVALTDPATVCDLGCGDGRVTWLIAERWARARLLGLDSSSEMLDDARGRAAEHPAERAARIEWRHGDIRTWCPNGRFDLIFSNAVLHWVEESHGSKHKEVRYLDIHEAEEIDEGQLEAWVRQASEIPGWGTS